MYFIIMFLMKLFVSNLKVLCSKSIYQNIFLNTVTDLSNGNCAHYNFLMNKTLFFNIKKLTITLNFQN